MKVNLVIFVKNPVFNKMNAVILTTKSAMFVMNTNSFRTNSIISRINALLLRTQSLIF